MKPTHGMSRHPVYTGSWVGMKQRCLNPNAANYYCYGGRGIKICKRWLLFKNFWNDMKSTWRPGLSLDRINNDGDYTPENCRWATRSEQQQNKRPMTLEHCRKISQSRKGQTLSLEHRRQISATLRERFRLERESKANIITVDAATG